MSNWEKNVEKLCPYVPGEQPHEADMIKLNTNENPYPPSQSRRGDQTGNRRGYSPSLSGSDRGKELVQAIADIM